VIERLTLHIGHMKTGTTSIQATFRDSADVLAAHGLFHYARHRNHHPIARRFHGPTLRREDKHHFDRFVREVRATRCPRALVTSETFMRLSDEEAADCAAFFGRLAQKLDVILYVRHPVGFACSAAHQAVRTGRPLSEVVGSPRVLPLRETIERWRRAVGPGNVTVRPFVRPLLAGGDVVDDLLHVLGLPGAGAQLNRTRVNEGLSVLAIHLLDRANAFDGGAGLPRAGLRVFEAIAGPKYVLPQHSLDRVRGLAEPELAFLREDCGIELAEPRDAPTPAPGLEAAELDSLARALLAASRQAHGRDKAPISRLVGWSSPSTREEGRVIHRRAGVRRRLRVAAGLSRLLGGRALSAGACPDDRYGDDP